ncbi:MAG: CinA family protein [Pseudomonadota bacterium]
MQVFSQSLKMLAESVVRAARDKKMRIVTAESCTGGLIGACLTEIPGASDVFDQGFIAYSNNSKMMYLGVSRRTILDCGSVSAEVALEMAEGALRASGADIAVSATGIAGPGGGTADKPAGTVYLGVALREKGASHTLQNSFSGDRTEVRLKTVEAALTALKKEIEGV